MLPAEVLQFTASAWYLMSSNLSFSLAYNRSSQRSFSLNPHHEVCPINRLNRCCLTRFAYCIQGSIIDGIEIRVSATLASQSVTLGALVRRQTFSPIDFPPAV